MVGEEGGVAESEMRIFLLALVMVSALPGDSSSKHHYIYIPPDVPEDCGIIDDLNGLESSDVYRPCELRSTVKI